MSVFKRSLGRVQSFFAEKKPECLLFAALSIIVLSFAFFSVPVRHGDGHEYSLLAEAFIARQSPFFTDADIDARIAQAEAYPSVGFVKDFFGEYKRIIDDYPPNLPSDSQYDGVFRSRTGQFYSYHFWLYPAYVALAESGVRLAGGNPLSGFQVANGLLLLFVAGYCLFFVDGNPWRKCFLVAAFVLGGSVFYLKWTHPDVFITAFLFVGFVGLFQRRLYVALPCIALAAGQVVTIWTAYAAILLMIALVYRKGFFVQILGLMKSWWAWLFAVFPAISFIFYKVNFGSWNLIGEGWVDAELFSFSHFVSFWCDLDQGAFVGAPLVLFALAFFVVRIRKMGRDCMIDLVVAASGGILICLPLLFHVGVNSGNSVFLRNSFYAVTPLVAWTGFYFAALFAGRLSRCVALAAAAIYVVSFDGPFAREDYGCHKPWTVFLLNHAPSLYNPEPGVFFTRTEPLHREWNKRIDIPALYYDNDGVIRKILFRVDKGQQILSGICTEGLVDENGTLVTELKPQNVRYGWGYLSGRFVCKGTDLYRNPSIELSPRYDATLADGIDFSRNGFPSFVKMATGLSIWEKWGYWTNADAVTFKLSGTLGGKVVVRFRAAPFDDNLGKPVKVTLDGVAGEFVPTSMEAGNYDVSFDLPETRNIHILVIEPAHPHSPKSLGHGTDGRNLGLALLRIDFIQN